MRRLLLSMMTLAATVVSCFAAESYTPLVREGVEWAYLSHSQWAYDLAFYKLQFVGTKEINGKVYHNLQMYQGFPINGAYTSVTLGWLREEDRKVYVIFNDMDTVLNKEDAWLYNEGYMSPSSLKGDMRERLLYDFSLKKGDTFIPFATEDGESGYGTFTCVETGRISTPGGERQYWKFDNQISLTIVEGVGPMPENDYISYSMMDPYHAWKPVRPDYTRVDFMLFERTVPPGGSNLGPWEGDITVKSCVFDRWGVHEPTLWFSDKGGFDKINEVEAPADAFSFDMGADGVKVTGAATELARVKVYDLAGREHMSVSPLDGRVSIPYTLLPPGVAIIRAEDPDGASRSLKVAVPARD